MQVGKNGLEHFLSSLSLYLTTNTTTLQKRYHPNRGKIIFQVIRLEKTMTRKRYQELNWLRN